MSKNAPKPLGENKSKNAQKALGIVFGVAFVFFILSEEESQKKTKLTEDYSIEICTNSLMANDSIMARYSGFGSRTAYEFSPGSGREKLYLAVVQYKLNGDFSYRKYSCHVWKRSSDGKIKYSVEHNGF